MAEQVKLYWSPDSGPITCLHPDGHLRKIPVGEAEWLWKMGHVNDYNRAFGRLVRYNFKLKAAIASYQLEEQS